MFCKVSPNASLDFLPFTKPTSWLGSKCQVTMKAWRTSTRWQLGNWRSDSFCGAKGWQRAQSIQTLAAATAVRVHLSKIGIKLGYTLTYYEAWKYASSISKLVKAVNVARSCALAKIGQDPTQTFRKKGHQNLTGCQQHHWNLSEAHLNSRAVLSNRSRAPQTCLSVQAL